MANEIANSLMVSQGTLLAGEDLTNNRLLTRKPVNYTNISFQFIKTGAGVVRLYSKLSHFRNIKAMG